MRMLLNQQLFKCSHAVVCTKRLYPQNTFRSFSSSNTVIKSTRCSIQHTRLFSTKPKVAVTECDKEFDDLGRQQQAQSTNNRRAINIKVPSKFRNQIRQSAISQHEQSELEPKKAQGQKDLKTFQDETNNMFVYIKDLNIYVDIQNAGKGKKQNIDLEIPDRKEILRLNFDNVDEVQIDNTSPSQNIQSVTDQLWREVKLDYSKLPQYYLKLSKARLTGLVVITTMAGYGVAPDAFHLGTFLLCSLGTALTSSSANAVNQYFEVPFDSQMNRTKNRVLVRGHLSPLHAASFAVISGSLGLTILTVGVNPLTAALGAFNLGLYTLVYTPMKRYSIANTWVGSVVGAIPPMMGWTACTGMLEPGAWLLGAILYAWQFPHFNALSWNLRPDYSRGGYRMCSVVRPEMCKRVALRYSAGMIALCSAAPLVDLTTWTFVIDSLPLNVYLTYLAWNFYRKGDSNSSRKLFKFTLIHIPLLMILMFISKKGSRENPGQQALVVDTVT